MRASLVYPLLWVAWIVAFLAIELTALWTGHQNFTLSEYVWKLEQINRGWTFLRFFICVFCVWLFGHMVWGIWRLWRSREALQDVPGDHRRLPMRRRRRPA